MTTADGLLHELLDVTEDIYKSGFITEQASQIIEKTLLYLYYQDKPDPEQWRSAVKAMMQKRGLAPAGKEVDS